MSPKEFVEKVIQQFDGVIESATLDSQKVQRSEITDAVLTCLFSCREQLAETKAITELSAGPPSAGPPSAGPPSAGPPR